MLFVNTEIPIVFLKNFSRDILDQGLEKAPPVRYVGSNIVLGP